MKGFWSSNSMLRLRRRLLIQPLQRKENSGAFPAPVGMFGYRRSDSSVYPIPLYPMFGCRRVISSKLFFTSIKHNKDREQPPTRTPFSFFPRWWVFGSFLSIMIHTWKQSWDKLQTLEGEAEMMIEEGESVAEAVEKAAEITEKVTAEIAEKLPENSKLKEAAETVQHYSKAISYDAHLTQLFLHKVEEWKVKLDKAETTMNDQAKLKEDKAYK